MSFPIEPPIAPMLAKPTPEIPTGEGWISEPKWDGFRALVFRDGDDVYLQSRDLKPLNRYFPELEEPLRGLGGSASRFVLDGEVVIARPDGGLDFDALLLRIHPAASRVRMLAEQSPASFVAFDCLADGPDDLRERPFSERRERLEGIAADPPASVRLTPSTTDPEVAQHWFSVFEGAGLDGEIVIVGSRGLDFEALQLRLHPAASRVKLLSEESPASFVAFDCLADGTELLLDRPFAERRARLERLLSGAPEDVRLTPSTTDPATAQHWFDVFEGAGLDGVIAKRAADPYAPGKRTMAKIKHLRTADCVVAGFRWHKNGPGTHVGSLMLGLYNDAGDLQSVGVTSSFTMAKRVELVELLEPYRSGGLEDHPWRDWAIAEASAVEQGRRLPGAQSRWNRGKDLSWEPLRPELVCEVAFDHLQRDRFRHATTFRRWRPDRSPADCRYDQLEETPPALLADLFGT